MIGMMGFVAEAKVPARPRRLAGTYNENNAVPSRRLRSSGLAREDPLAGPSCAATGRGGGRA